MAKSIRVGGLRVDLELIYKQFQNDITRVEKSIQKLGKGFGDFQANIVAINQSVQLAGTIFNKLSGTITGTMSRLQEASRIEGLANAFDRLQESVGANAFDTLPALRQATQGLISDLDLFQSANQAVLLGVDRGTGEFDDLAGAAVRLGRAMGIDAKASIDSLVIGIGRQSRLVLDNLGVIVDSERAYKDYAAALHTTVSALTDQQKQLAFNEAAFEAIRTKAASLVDVEDNAATAATRLAATYTNQRSEALLTFAANENLRDSINDLARTIQDADFGPLITALAEIASFAIKAAAGIAEVSRALQQAQLDGHARKLGQILGKGAGDAAEYFGLIVTQLKPTAGNIERAREALKQLHDEFTRAGWNARRQAAPSIDLLNSMLRKFEQRGQLSKKEAVDVEKAIRSLAETAKSEGAEGASKFAEALAKLNEQLDKLKREIELKGLNESLEDALKLGDLTRVTQLRDQIDEATRAGVLAGLDEAVRNTSAAREYAELMGEEATKAIDERIAESLKEAHADAVETWRKLFENAITGVTFDLEDALKQVAVGFAAELAAQMSGTFGEGIKSPQDIGGEIAKGIGSVFSELKSLIGSGPGSFSEAQAIRAGDLVGPLTQGQAAATGMQGMAGQAGVAIAVANGIDAISNIGKSTEKSIEAGTTLAFTAAGAAIGGPIGAGIGSVVGKLAGGLLGHAFGGDTDPAANAREAFVKALNEAIGDRGLVIQNPAGSFAQLDHFSILGGGRNKFSPGESGFSFFNELKDEARETFGALGLAFKNIFELEDADAAQLGAILSENLLGSIDNARLLVQKLGLDFQQLSDIALEAARAGDISWLEFNTTIRGLGEAFEPGLEALGAVGQAFDNLIASGGRGVEAIKAVRDLAVETQEAGGESLEDLRAHLLASGKSADEVNKIMETLAARGVTSLEELVNASDELAGAIVGDLEAAGLGFAQLGEDVTRVRDVLEQINETELKAKQLRVDVVVNDPSGALNASADVSAFRLGGVVERFATGGIVNSPTMFRHVGGMGLMGEAGPEAILPLRRTRGGRLGVDAAGMTPAAPTIVINAPNATPGVEARIVEALSMVKDLAVAEAVQAVADAQERGRFL